jgi:excisionase family DNA binding protein
LSKAGRIKESAPKQATKTLSDLAEALGVSVSTIRRAADRKEIQTVRYGWEIRIHDDEFDRVLIEGFAPPTVRREPVSAS